VLLKTGLAQLMKIGVFEMREKGLVEVENPSEVFLKEDLLMLMEQL